MLAALKGGMHSYLEELMNPTTWRPESEYFNRILDEGAAEAAAAARAEAVLTFLAARGIGVTDDARARIAECADPDELDAWVSRAAIVDSVEELFRD